MFLKRPPDFVIGPKNDPYMERWWIIPRNKYFNIYLHHIRHDDDDRALHDHPWWSISFLLKGALLEVYKTPDGETHRIISSIFPVYRSSTFAHKLQLLTPDGAWTLFITGPVVRTWGFHCPKGWVDWKYFTKPGEKGQIGRGCGEYE